MSDRIENASKQLESDFRGRNISTERLKSAIWSAIHAYGDYKTDTCSDTSYEDMVVRIGREVTVIEWIAENPHTAYELAIESHNRRCPHGCYLSSEDK